MASFKRDGDRRPVSGGVSTTDSSTPVQFRFDPVFNRLLVDLVAPGSLSQVLHTEVGHDQNRKTTVYGVSDDANKNLMPILVDHVNGYILVDVI